MREDVIAQVIEQFPQGYEPLNRDGSTIGDGPIQKLGDGGSSVVIRALYKEKLPRALKFIIPRDDLSTSQSGSSLFANSFTNEVESLSELSHERIARITDFGSVQVSDSPVAFFAMELIPGQPFDVFARQDEVAGAQIISAFGQLLDGLEFLHFRQVMHCDVKPDNFLVVGGDELGTTAPQSYLVDLGVSHHLDEALPPDEWTYFFTTKGYHLPDLENVVANRSHNRIQRKRLRDFFPAQDLFSVGAIINGMLAEERVAHKLRGQLGADSMHALRAIADGLSCRKEQQTFRSVVEVREAFRRIPSASLAPLGDRNLATSTSRGIVLPDVVGRIATSGKMQSIVSHPMFQRLHQLPQLDLMQYILPGGTHTRFAHALREMSLARKAINYQLNNWEFRLAVSAEDISHTILSALVNSVGRYQLLHMFEDFFPTRGRIPEAGLLTSDELLDSMVGHRDSTLSERLAKITDERGRSFAQVLDVDWDRLRGLRDRPKDPTQGFLAALIDSPLDVNKLAYLRADSIATGMPFGLGINHDALFEQFRLPDHDDWLRSDGQHRAILAIREDGISYAEAAMMTRYWNIQSGYWNRTNRALQAMVKYVIGELLKAKRLDFDDYCMATLHLPTSEALRYLSDHFDRAVAEGTIERMAVNPLHGLLISQRNAYRRLLTISPKSTVEARSKDAMIFQKVQARSPLEDASLCSIFEEVITDLVPDCAVRPGEILVDVPRATREESKGKILIYSDPPDAASIGDLVRASPVLQNLGQSFELYVKRM